MIFLIEDNPDDEALTLRALKKNNLGNEVVVARDGAEALDFLFGTGLYEGRDLNKMPQLTLLDLNLPKVDGLSVLRRIKRDPATRSIPVIVLTVSRNSQDIIDSQQLGAEAYIVKPVGFHNLTEVTPQLRMRWALLEPKEEATTVTQ